MTLLLSVVAITLSVSALCSLFEATLYSTRVATLEAARTHGPHVAGAERFLRMKRHITGPTSAILILNTIANTAGATVAGMLAAEALGGAYIPLFSAALTLGILVFSEILPKTYGAIHWKPLWPVVVWPLSFLEKALRPLIWLSQSFTSLFMRKQPGPATTEDEIIAMIRMSAHAGELTDTELQLLTAVFRFDESQAQDIMFPRRDAVFFDASWNVRQCLAVAMETKHTRYPLCDGDMDNLLGMLHVKDLLLHLDDPEVDLRALARPLRRVPATMPARGLLRAMQRAQPHMVAVIDEHGTTIGLVTLENVLEQLVGSVQDEFDREEPDIVAAGEDKYIARGAVSLARVNVELDLNLSDSEVSTLSGAIVNELGRLPQVGDKVDLGPVVAEVLAVSNDRADSVLVQVKDVAGASPEPAPDGTES